MPSLPAEKGARRLLLNAGKGADPDRGNGGSRSRRSQGPGRPDADLPNPPIGGKAASGGDAGVPPLLEARPSLLRGCPVAFEAKLGSDRPEPVRGLHDDASEKGHGDHSTVTDLARFRGWSISHPRDRAT